MERSYFIQLTNELYRLTLLFPKKEPLRYKMRELADEILANSISFSKENPRDKFLTVVKNLQDELDILDGFFEVARNQNWVSPDEILNLQQEYNRLKDELTNLTLPLFPEGKKPETGSLAISNLGEEKATMLVRQQRILEILREKGRAQVWQIKQVFPQVSKRTLRRDFENLVKQGIIDRVGQKNNTFYQLKLGQTSII